MGKSFSFDTLLRPAVAGCISGNVYVTLVVCVPVMDKATFRYKYPCLTAAAAQIERATEIRKQELRAKLTLHHGPVFIDPHAHLLSLRSKFASPSPCCTPF